MHVRDYLEDMRRKPEHIRQRIALGVSVGITFLIAAGYVLNLSASGALSLAPAEESRNIADATGRNVVDDLTAAAGAFGDVFQEASEIQIIETEAETTLPEGETVDTRTVIPF
ncbi:MAG: hypothetical protein WBK28_03495 [Minisyncoccia bacterium]